MISREEADHLFDQLDLDGNGVLNFIEAKAGAKKLKVFRRWAWGGRRPLARIRDVAPPFVTSAADALVSTHLSSHLDRRRAWRRP